MWSKLLHTKIQIHQGVKYISSTSLDNFDIKISNPDWIFFVVLTQDL